MPAQLDSLKPRLYQAALAEAFRAELELAQGAWLPEPEDWTDFVDMLAISWVDAEGFTLLERELGTISNALHRRWHLNQRSGLFVVDGGQNEMCQIRDTRTEEALCLRMELPLTKGSLLRGRLIEAQPGIWTVTGQPDVFHSLSVIQRMDLLHSWLEGPRHALLSAQEALRSAFLHQREQRLAFIEYFGRDIMVFGSPADAAFQIDCFYQHLLTKFRPPSLEGLSYLDEYLATGAEGPTEHRLELDAGLEACATIGVIFDDIDGVHFLPDYKGFCDTIEGNVEGSSIVKRYLDDPGVTDLPFRRTDSLDYLRQHLSMPGASLVEVLAKYKPTPPRRAPSLLPGPGQ